MQTLVLYDISDNKLRRRMEILCKNQGLARAQKSAFIGDIETARRKELETKTRELMNDREDYNIRIIPLCATDASAAVLITNAAPEPEKTEIEQLGIVIV